MKFYIFNSTFFINKISKDLNLFQNTIVENIEHKNNKIFLICKNEGKKFDVEFDKLIITAGTINTTKLVLKLFSSRKKKSYSYSRLSGSSFVKISC